jgi:dephospho-CoA kinase
MSSQRFSLLSSGHPSQSRPADVPVVGIVGGVGAGKSSIIRQVTKTRLCIIDADRIGHEQLLVDDIRKQIVSEFGDQVLDEHGEIDRRRLAAEVFGSSSLHQQKLERLNGIVHPAIQSEIRRQIRAVTNDVDAIIIDAALLLEAGWKEECDALVFVDTPIQQRQARVALTRGWSADEHQRRESSQWSLERKRESCQFVVDNSGPPEPAAKHMEQFLKEIIQQKKQQADSGGDIPKKNGQHTESGCGPDILNV